MIRAAWGERRGELAGTSKHGPRLLQARSPKGSAAACLLCSSDAVWVNFNLDGHRPQTHNNIVFCERSAPLNEIELWPSGCPKLKCELREHFSSSSCVAG